MQILYKSDPQRGALWQQWLAQHAPDIQLHLWPEIGDPQEIEVLIAWQPPETLMETFPNLKVLLSVGAGADQFDLAALPPDLPVVRMIEPGLTQGMVEYVTFAVLGLHRDMVRYLRQQREEKWLAHSVKPRPQRRGAVRWRDGAGRTGTGCAAAAGVVRL
jgi:glyoxylate/hydroxypyruvate reductase A